MTPPRALRGLAAALPLLAACGPGEDEGDPGPGGATPAHLAAWVRIAPEAGALIDFSFAGDEVVWSGSSGRLRAAPALGGPSRDWSGGDDFVSVEVVSGVLYGVDSKGNVSARREGELGASPIDFPPSIAGGPGFGGPWLRAAREGWLLSLGAWEGKEGGAFVRVHELRAWQPETDVVTVIARSTGAPTEADRAITLLLESLAPPPAIDRDGVVWHADGDSLSMLRWAGEGALPESLPVLRAEGYSPAWAPAAHPEGGMVLPFQIDPTLAAPVLLRVLPGGVTELLLDDAPASPARTRIHDGYVYVAASGESADAGLWRTAERVLPAGASSEPAP